MVRGMGGGPNKSPVCQTHAKGGFVVFTHFQDKLTY
jgi:hypothetical protein